mmetsp:Transcript_5390/g.8507  ORF Transcript_5390/g.8507 Transcript_5390/m.8507 type:complete len:175 (+) Transcript_5390:336-860(+)|eukprot:CAMPEP_0178754508 /NCGR_PEP_ID=MMETSP0744-20121128/12199_1 /TAXON_ID=913974 /ORGANISM="Nitzschia punctata, Strain CCMP561" /LENGTH=174 /DNA_ID=CAMNT_0020408429 /DNA_START=211 /DNA_END=735 /DNA_ORIENTATION=+
MGGSLSTYTALLADSLCGGSSRRLIAGWWYSILGLTGVLALMSCAVMSTRGMSETFTSIWSALMLLALSIGGTMIMRKFHNSMAVGFFMGGVVAMSQMFFFLMLLYLGYRKDQKNDELPIFTETLMALFCLCQSVLLGTFAAILGAHRSEILEKQEENASRMADEPYQAPYERS